jgi:2-methylcitrate dehydratase PrpD
MTVAPSALPTDSGAAEDLTRQVAEFIVRLRYEDLPEAVVTKTKQLVRDGIGNQLAASSLDTPARHVLDLFRAWGGSEDATVAGYGDRLPIAHAAMVNAMLGHGVELDDAHANALTKSGSALIPATIAFSELTQASGRDAIAAAVAGYDVMIRIGLAVNPAHRQRGYHTTGTASPFGVAAIGAKLLRLTVEETQWALGLAGMQSAGVQAYLDDPCMAKPFSPGKGAFNGTLAALLASKGFTGPRTILEGKEGFLNAFAGEYDVGEIRNGLGTNFKVLEVAFKPHAACRYAHGPIDAAQVLHDKHGIRAEDIRAVTVRMSELAIRQSGRTEIPSLNAAMGSTPFGVVVGLLYGSNGLPDYRTAFEDRTVHDITQEVSVEPYDDAGVMGRSAVVSATLASGEVIEHRVAGPRGEPGNPLSDEELHEKFLGLAALALGQDRSVQLSNSIQELDEIKNLRQLVPQLVTSGHA